MADCKNDLQGNYVSWNKGWELFNVESTQQDIDDICRGEKGLHKHFWFPDIGQRDAFYVCNALGGILPEISNVEEAVYWHELSSNRFPNASKCQTKYWTPLTDIEEEGVFKRSYDPETTGNTFWAEGEPDGLHYQNCALIYLPGNRDVNCPVTFQCAICLLTEPVTYSMRGTCETDKRHTYFNSYQSTMGHLEFIGFGGYHIERSGNTWIWKESRNGKTIATMVSTTPNYPMGRRVWDIEVSMCDQKTGQRQLLLTPCKLDEFTCDDAMCIPLENRCDLKYDCLDHSDEVDCQLVKFPAGYQHDLPPRQTSSSGESYLLVTSNITVESIAVDTMDMVMVVSYELKMSWFDNRLLYLNLKEQTSLNALPYSVLRELWNPAISFVNTEGGSSSIVDKEAMMTVNRYSESYSRDITKPAEGKFIFTPQFFSAFSYILEFCSKIFLRSDL